MQSRDYRDESLNRHGAWFLGGSNDLAFPIAVVGVAAGLLTASHFVYHARNLTTLQLLGQQNYQSTNHRQSRKARQN